MSVSADFSVGRVASGAAWLYVMQVVDYSLAFAFYVVVTRSLPAAEVGSYSLLLSLVMGFVTFTLLALNLATIKLVSEHLGRGEVGLAVSVAKKILRFVVVFSVPSFVVMAALSPVLSRWVGVGVSVMVLALVAALTLDFTGFLGGVMYGLGMYREVAVQNMVYYCFSRIPAMVGVRMGFGLSWIVLSLLFGALVCLVYSVAKTFGFLREGGADGYPVGRIFSFSLPLYGNNVIMFLQGWLDVIVLSAFVDLGTLGPYFMAVSSISAASALWVPLTSALFPALSSYDGAGREDAVRDALGVSSKLLFLVVLPVGLSLAVVSRTALSFVYGNVYGSMAVPFSVLAASLIVPALGSLFSTALQARGLTRPVLAAGVMSTGVYMALLPPLSVRMGPVGAAVSRVCMYVVGSAALYAYCSGWLSLGLDGAFVGKLAALSLVPALLLAVVFVFAFVLGLRVFRPLEGREADLLSEALPERLKFLVGFVK